MRCAAAAMTLMLLANGPGGSAPPAGSPAPAAAESGRPWLPLPAEPLGYRGARYVATTPPAGGRWTRITVPWQRIERSRGKLDWRSLDAEVRGLQAAGIQPLPVLQARSDWAGTPEQIYTARAATAGQRQSWLPPEPGEWVRFVAAAVERYDGDGENDMPGLGAPLLDWQLEREYPRSWSGTPEEYLRCARLTREGMRRANPEVRLAMAGLVSEQVTAFAVCDGLLDPAGLELHRKPITRGSACHQQDIGRHRSQVEAVLAAAGGLFDALDVHLYGDRGSIPARIAWVRGRARAAGYEPAIWVLEGGGPYASSGETYTPSAEAEYLVRWFVTVLDSGAARVAWSFAPPSGKWGKEIRNLGLVNSKGRPKPAYTAYRVMAATLEGADGMRSLDLAPPIRGFEFRRPGGPVRVLWSAAPIDLRLPWPGGPAEVTTIDGGLVVVPTPAADLVLRLSGSPVFVAGSAP